MFVQTIALKDVKFYAYHGFYPEEQLTGNHFLVDAEVTFTPSGDTEDLLHTVNYEVINAIITKAMKETQKLLETVVKNIIDELLSNYSFLLTIVVGIRKIHPMMPGEIGHSFVQLSYTSSK
ncbi:dihydroneopterin aldolase [Pedobacter frigiditerrae]|uniref:Dihydroneopterin aldolase n=1 Tax=Pedobacter frigiditerrae TaxID=2530452 RepID=A0A4V2MIW4_9SPHI|nr:dihydroneopterin aldolase [Pedobacter frigiditerrae]TCC91596.1 dihydroneopterin aldolase [Pedobacter frigiditerrae]